MLVRCGAALIAFAAALALSLQALPAQAQSGVSGGTLSLVCRYGQGDDAQPVVGDGWIAYRVASAQASNDAGVSFVTDPLFADLGIDWTDRSAEGLAQAAHRLATVVDGRAVDKFSARSDDAGLAAFGPVPAGAYLVVRSDAAAANVRLASSAFVAFVPDQAGEGDGYDVVAYPKFEERGPGGAPGAPVDTPDDTSSGSEGAPVAGASLTKTGDSPLALAVAALCIASGSLALVASFMRRSRGRGDSRSGR